MLHCTTSGKEVGIGASAKEYHLTGNEMQRLTTNGMVLGGDKCGNQLVNGITAAHSASVSEVVTLAAARNDNPAP